MSIETLLSWLAVFATLFFLVHLLVQWILKGNAQADYDVRELAGELTPQELADEAQEDKAARERLASKYSTYSDF